MTKKLNYKIILFALIVSVSYFSTYFTRKSYAVSLPEIITITGLTKDLLSIPVTVLFIAYGVFQVVAGIICDRTKFKYFVPISLCITGIINIIVSFNLGNIVLVSILWGINGLAQGFIWPSILKLCSDTISEKNYSSVITSVTVAAYLGQCALYVFAWLFIKYIDFKTTFYLAAGLSIGVAIIYTMLMKFVDFNENKEKETNNTSLSKISTATSFMSLMFVFILISIIFLGAYRDSLETWTPTFISEAFKITSDNAIIASIILPLLGVISVEVVLLVYKRFCKNPIKISIVMCVLSAVCTVILLLFGNNSVTLSLVMMALSYGLSCAINHTLISFIPIYYKDSGKVSTVAGLLNAFPYIGSATATYVIGYVSRDDVFGWTGAIYTWLICIGLSILLLIFVVFRWKNFSKDKVIE